MTPVLLYLSEGRKETDEQRRLLYIQLEKKKVQMGHAIFYILRLTQERNNDG